MVANNFPHLDKYLFLHIALECASSYKASIDAYYLFFVAMKANGRGLWLIRNVYSRVVILIFVSA
jgi:hypothetical protein